MSCMDNVRKEYSSEVIRVKLMLNGNCDQKNYVLGCIVVDSSSSVLNDETDKKIIHSRKRSFAVK